MVYGCRVYNDRAFFRRHSASLSHVLVTQMLMLHRPSLLIKMPLLASTYLILLITPTRLPGRSSPDNVLRLRRCHHDREYLQR